MFNFLRGNLSKYTYNSKKQEKLSQSTRNKLLNLYQDSIGLPENLLHTTQHATDYLADRNKSLSTISDITFSETEEIKQLATRLSSLDTMLREIGGRYHPDDLRWYLQGEREYAITLIKNQQIVDLETIKNSSLDENAKDSAIKKLQEVQKTQLETLEKKFEESVTSIHQAAQKEVSDRATDASLREFNQWMKQCIDRAARSKTKDRINISMKTSSAILKDLSFEQLVDAVKGDFRSLTNRPLNVQKDDKGHYSISLSFPSDSFLRTLFSPSNWSYYKNRSNLSLLDFSAAAHLLKRSGEKYPIIEITRGDPDIQMKLAHDAFEALRAVGYEEKDITVNIDGKKYTVDELFKENPSRKKAIDIVAQKEATARSSQSTAEEQQMMKQTLDNYRATLPPSKPSTAVEPDVAPRHSLTGRSGG